jgi:integrase
MGLTVAKIDAAKPAAKDHKLHDTDGLFLLVTTKGAKWWRLKYRFAGKEKSLSLGTYPEVSLKNARLARNEARTQVAAGIDPSAERKKLKAAVAAATVPKPALVTVSTAAAAWISYHSKDTPDTGREWSDSYTEQVENRLKRHVLKHIGAVPVEAVKGDLLLKVLGPLGSDIQHRIKRDLYRFFAFAEIKGWRPVELKNPASDLEDLLKKRQKRKHFAGITDPDEFGGLLRASDCYAGTFITRTLLRLAPLLFQRPTELRHAHWNEFDLIAELWTIPAERMKSDEDHLVPLSRQAIAILEALQPVTRSAPNSLMFPGERPRGKDIRPLCDATVTAALANMGYRGRQTVHGFRASTRTILSERLKVNATYIERQLDHLTKAPNGRAYDRTEFMAERRVMMQLWADYLDVLKDEETGTNRFKVLINSLVKRAKALQDIQPEGIKQTPTRARTKANTRQNTSLLRHSAGKMAETRNV